MLIDVLARMESITVDRLQENAAVGRGRLCGKKILLAKPMTFMNNSGESVGRLARFYRVGSKMLLFPFHKLPV
jgi:PTH1 family peptidyl-tRNA hydrolase